MWRSVATRLVSSSDGTYVSGMTPRRILAATDFSASADHALDLAIAFARDLKAELILLHVTAPVMVLPPPLELLSMPALFPDLPRRISEETERRAGRAREAGLQVVSELRDGNPTAEIIRLAEERQVGLVVLGTHGHGGLAHVLGSVAERVVHKAPCPVLVVPDRRPR
jgi:nucleotide-binding universal stress UspA family protein